MLLLGHGRTTLYSHKNRPYEPNITQKGSVTCYRLLPHTHQVCHDVGRCVKSGSCSLSTLKWKVNEQYWWDILLSQEMLAVIKHVVDHNIICLSATQRMQAHHRMVRATQFNYCCAKPQLHFCWAMDPTGHSWTRLITRFKSLQQHENELQVNKID